MSPGPLPEYVDASLAFTHGDRINASVTARQLQRFRQYLYSESNPEADFRVELMFVRDAGDARRIKGHLSGSANLECQRCLGPVECELKYEMDLLVADSDEAARQTGAEEEVVIISERDGYRMIELLPLVEDGLILALPLVPRHEDGECEMAYSNQPTLSAATSAGIAGQDEDMQRKLQALRDELAAKNKDH